MLLSLNPTTFSERKSQMNTLLFFHLLYFIFSDVGKMVPNGHVIFNRKIQSSLKGSSKATSALTIFSLIRLL